jgi:hypothetical protein
MAPDPAKKPGVKTIITEKDGSRTTKIEGDWLVPETAFKTPKDPELDFKAWIDDHRKSERKELKIDIKDPVMNEYGDRAKKMFLALMEDGCPEETAMDLCCLVMYDLVVLLGRSGLSKL